MPLKLELALKASLFVIDVVTQLSGACSDTSTEAEFTERDEACPIMVMKTNAKLVSDDNFRNVTVGIQVLRLVIKLEFTKPNRKHLLGFPFLE